jgi:hypothetical protein
MTELIAIREAARRLGVSDTAVHKAIKSGRVSLGEPDPNNGRPRLPWPQAESQWRANSDATKRNHVGPQGNSPRRASYGGNTTPPAAPLPTAAQTLSGEVDPPASTVHAPGPAAPSLAASRAVREAYQARLARLEYEKATGKVVDADTVKVSAFKLARSLRDAMLNIPDRLAAELAAETNVARIHARLSRELRDALSSLAGSAP